MKKKKLKKYKFDWLLYFAIIGWGAIVVIWAYQSIGYFSDKDILGGILYVIVALAFFIIGFKSIKDHLAKKKK